VEGEADRLRRAAGVADAWPPRGGRALALDETASGNGHGATRSRSDTALGWAEREAHKRRALLQAGPASAVGRKRGGGPRMRKILFHLYFQEIFKCQLSNIILSKKMTSFENVPKMKVD